MEFKQGDWVYYGGAGAGGSDTGCGYWVKGVICQVDGYGLNGFLHVYNILNATRMKKGGNEACAFRLATAEELAPYGIILESTNYEIY